MTTPEARFEAEALPHLGSLFGTARFLAGDAAEAEDIVQEVYVQAWKSFARYKPGTNCRAWLYKILFHVMQHHRRRSYRAKRFFVAFGEEAAETAAVWQQPVPEDLRDEDVLRALGTIPENYRAVVLLVDVEGLSYREAADALDVPIGTIMSRLSRARAQLRGLLAETAREYGVGTGAPASVAV
jgi:RNA polymerase sigma-70 factor (ECF subfamily)